MASQAQSKRQKLSSSNSKASSGGSFANSTIQNDFKETSLIDEMAIFNSDNRNNFDSSSQPNSDCKSQNLKSTRDQSSETSKQTLARDAKTNSNNNNNGTTKRQSSAEKRKRRPSSDHLGDEEDDDDDDEDDDDPDDDDEDDDDDDEDDDDDQDEDDEDEDEDDDDDDKLGARPTGNQLSDIQVQLAAAGPAGVAAAAAIATARKRKRPHSFETNPSVRKRQQTRLIRKLRACIDEYTMRVGQQAVVLITMPGKAVHNFKVFGAQPLENVIRSSKQEIMSELEQALLEQAPQRTKDEDGKHELPALVIDGIPTPVEKMTQAQLRAFIPLMLKYSTGRGKPGWGKESTRPPWWPESLPWANVRSDARDELEKQRISWTTTLRQIVTNCYKYHGRDDLLPSFDENEESLRQQQQRDEELAASSNYQRKQQHQQLHYQATGSSVNTANDDQQQQAGECQVYSVAPGYGSNFVHTITNADGSVSLIQVDPTNAQILTLPDGTQVRAVRLQTLAGGEALCHEGAQHGTDLLADGSTLELATGLEQQQQQQQQSQQQQLDGEQLTLSEASIGPEGQIIVTGEDGTQSCYPMSSLVSIPASVYQQFASSGQQQQLSLVASDNGSGQLQISAIQQTTASGDEPSSQEQRQGQQVQIELQQVQLVEQQPPEGGQSQSRTNKAEEEPQANGFKRPPSSSKSRGQQAE